MVFMTYLYRMARGAAPLALWMALVGCNDGDPPPRREPPPPPAAKPATCSGERKVNDPRNLALLPPETGSFCIDPNASDRGFGEGAQNPIDGICDLFDGECEIYKRFDVKQVVEARYVDGSGSGSTIDVKLSMFGSRDNAYAMFTKRVVGDNDPAHEDTPKRIDGGGAAALGWGNAYLWRGQHLAEIVYSDAGTASDKEIKAKGEALLPPLVKAMGDKLPGDLDLPEAAAALPTDKRLEVGVRFDTQDVLDVPGTGPGAYGYYADGPVRWRAVSIVKADADQAADALASFGKVAGATAEKGIGDGAYRVMLKFSGPQTEWLVAQKGKRVLGIGDEPRALRDGMGADEHRKATLSQAQKRELLQALLAQ